MNPRPTPIDWTVALAEHRSWLRKVLRCRVKDVHAIDDLMQELALSVVRQAKQKPDSVPVNQDKVAPWLYRIAVRQTINHYRRAGRKSAAKPVEDLDGFDREAEPVDWLMSRELHDSVRQSLERLPAKDRELLVLKYTENWSYRQLAEHLGVRPRTIEYRLMRAKDKMRRMLTANVDLPDHSATTSQSHKQTK
ncbi:MAG: sigma-70 family RNA polymerase sigma factor [Planctomycetota bacterium]